MATEISTFAFKLTSDSGKLHLVVTPPNSNSSLIASSYDTTRTPEEIGKLVVDLLKESAFTAHHTSDSGTFSAKAIGPLTGSEIATRVQEAIDSAPLLSVCVKTVVSPASLTVAVMRDGEADRSLTIPEALARPKLLYDIQDAITKAAEPILRGYGNAVTVISDMTRRIYTTQASPSELPSALELLKLITAGAMPDSARDLLA